MIIDCISDLHGHYPELEGGNLLLVAGDVTNHDHEAPFALWIEEQPYEKIIWIAGNHDNIWFRSWVEHGEKRRPKMKEGKWKGPERDEKIEYLCDNGTIFEGIKIWGSPWSLWFPEINPHCCAFTGSEKELLQKYKKIPEGTDILITHGPPYGYLDKLERNGECAGSLSLLKAIKKIRPKLVVYGHIHEGYGQYRPHLEPWNLPGYPIFVNASHVNERYEPVNEPIRIVF